MAKPLSAKDTKPRLRRNERRQALSAAARRVLEREGHAKLTLELVADEAEVSKTIVYRNFDSRDHLIESVVDAEMQQLIQSVRGSLREKNVEHLIRRGAKNLLNHVDKHREAFLAVVGRTPMSWKPDTHAVNVARREIRAGTARFLTLKAKKKSQVQNAEILAHTVIGIGMNFAIWWLEESTTKMNRSAAEKFLTNMMLAVVGA
jgi:AcrR family transcriptional regulator